MAGSVRRRSPRSASIPTKNLAALGDGGAVATGDATSSPSACAGCASTAGRRKYRGASPAGRNSRLDELQAAILRTRLAQLDAANERRRAIVARYAEALAPRTRTASSRATPRTTSPSRGRVVEERERVRAALRGAEIGTDVHYPIADHRQPALGATTIRTCRLPVTEHATEHVLTLPCFPGAADDEIERSARRCLRGARSRHDAGRNDALYSVVVPVYKNEPTLPAARRAPRRARARARRRRSRSCSSSTARPTARTLLRGLLSEERALLVAADRALAELRLVQRDQGRARGGRGRLRRGDGGRSPGAGLARRGLLRALATGEYDIAVGVRAARDDPRVDVLPASRSSGGLPPARPAGDPAGRSRRLRLHAPGRRPARCASTSRTRASSGCSTGSASAASRFRTRVAPRPSRARAPGASGASCATCSTASSRSPTCRSR